MIPYGRQEILESDIQAVNEVLRSDFLTQGPAVPRFEDAVAKHCGVSEAVAFSSATTALHVACMALGLGQGDWLWTSPITFVASANCALYCGAKVDFVDIDKDTYNMCPAALEKKLLVAEKEGRLPKIVVPVHLCGQPCDMASIASLARRFGFKVLEDASHAIGGKYQGRAIGSCEFSDITIFSFHPVKIITSGEGGMATTRSGAIAERMRLLRSHGITRDPTAMTHEPDGPWYYQQIELGFNYRMTDIQAALGASQMERLNSNVAKRHRLARRYDSLFEELNLKTPWQHSDSYSAFHLYVVRIPDVGGAGDARATVFKILRDKGVGVNVHYIPVYRQPYYSKFGFDNGSFPQAEAYYREAISLPLFAALAEEQQDHVVQAIKTALNAVA